jgi:hypothetical protein
LVVVVISGSVALFADTIGPRTPSKAPERPSRWQRSGNDPTLQ